MPAPRSATVRVPASSANLGPGFDSFAAALELRLEVEAVQAGRFAIVTDLQIARDRRNLVARGFAAVHPVDGVELRIRSEIPLSGGLGSSAAAYVAGLLAARALHGGDVDVLRRAAQLEGHPDNVAAAVHGGVVVCAPGPDLHVATLPAPTGLTPVLVVPRDAVHTRQARAALPAQVPMADAVANLARASLLVLGLERGDPELVARGLQDRLHQPHRAHLYPRSAELVRDAAGLGALGATISGAGPTVLVWCRTEDAERITVTLRERAAGWAQVLPTAFAPRGAEVVG